MDTIYEYCFDYGYETIAVQEEWGEVEYTDILQLATGSEEPDDFYDEFGENAEWNTAAERAGMISALKDLSGKTYKIWTDGYRMFAYTGTKKEIEAYNEKLNARVDWSSILHF